jgi:hypothetical protein
MAAKIGALALAPHRGYGHAVRLALAVCVLLLSAPAVALAREPVISYVDQDGVFRLYDEQTETEVSPPPPVPSNFSGFKYGMSLNGRYIVFNDNPAPRKLHLLDRATNTQVQLPGIDVYNEPGSLTVSDNGLIAFDDNGNGPAVVYSSAAKQFLDSGLAADNHHRQTRLSGDGRFLGTTCNEIAPGDCIDDLNPGADPYVQDLGAKLDTGFPNDANRDEEHPCVNGDGSVFGIDKDRAAAMATPNDVFLFDRSVSPPQPIVDAAFANTEMGDEVNCVLDSDAAYLGLFNNTTAVFSVFVIADGVFLSLPPDAEFSERSLFSAPYPPPQPPGGGPTGPAPDTTKPVLRKLGMTHRRFRVRRGATAFRFRLSEKATVKIVVKRRGKRIGTIRKRGLSKGAHRIRFNGRLKGRKLKPGRYLAVLTATDAAGNVSRARTIRFRVLRPAGDRPR